MRCRRKVRAGATLGDETPRFLIWGFQVRSLVGPALKQLKRVKNTARYLFFSNNNLIQKTVSGLANERLCGSSCAVCTYTEVTALRGEHG